MMVNGEEQKLFYTLYNSFMKKATKYVFKARHCAVIFGICSVSLVAEKSGCAPPPKKNSHTG